MKYLSLILLVSVLLNCKAQEVTNNAKNTLYSEKEDGCNPEEIALNFLNDYSALDYDDDVDAWIAHHKSLTTQFKRSYNDFMHTTEYIDANPILLAQDTPEALYVADVEKVFVFIRDYNWSDYYNYVIVEDCKIDGVGDINIEDLNAYKPLDEEQLNARINSIRSTYAHINSQLDSYEIIEHLDESASSESTEGSATKLYLKDNQFVKIEEVFYGEMGNRKLDYYYDSQGLCFVLEQISHYNAPIYATNTSEDGMEAYDESKTIVEEHRYYFDDGRLVKWIDENNTSVEPYYNKFKYKYLETLDWDWKFQ